MIQQLILLLLMQVYQLASARPYAGTSEPQAMPEATRAEAAVFGQSEQPTENVTQPSQLDGRYVVVFKQNAGSPTAVADQLIAQVSAALSASAGPTRVAGMASEVQVVNFLGGVPQPPAVAAAAAAVGDSSNGDSSSSSATNTGLQGVLLSASADAFKLIQESELVALAFPDHWVYATVQQPAASSSSSRRRQCIESEYLPLGIAAAVSANFRWPNALKCITTNTQLMWYGRPCTSDASKVQYIELRAVDKRTGATMKVSGKDCIIQPNPKRAALTTMLFGGCGNAPQVAKSLPVNICPIIAPPPGGSVGSPSPGPFNSSPPGSSGDPIEPIISGPHLPRTPVAAGEIVPGGISRIEAARTSGIANIAGLPADQQVVVAVVDSGVDASHPDINYVGGANHLDGIVASGSLDPAVDVYSHGTAIAGIIGAKNNGQGIVGVSPGVGIYSLKVLDDNGDGTLGSVLNAMHWVATEGVNQGIKVINLSLAAYHSISSPIYQSVYDGVCGFVKEASNAGVVVVAASGNNGANVREYFPAACIDLAAVTALDSAMTAAAAMSNWLPADASQQEKAHVFAAPGSAVYTTCSYSYNASGYTTLVGTSMAAPHVAGVAANCIMSSACTAGTTGAARLDVLQAAAEERLAMQGQPPYSYSAPAGRWYGNVVWSKY